MEFRLLRADEIDARISQCGDWGISILLYKDARCDQNILDETVGSMNWQRHHSRDNANCTVSIWDAAKNQWIEKEDTGTESNTEKEKGLASDSFKRACFNWGIGRELYTAPTMFVKSADLKTLKEYNGRWTCKDYFSVTDIQYTNRKISYVQIRNEKTGKYLDFGKKIAEQKPVNVADLKPIMTAKQEKMVEKVMETIEHEPVYNKEFLEKHGNERIGDIQIAKLQAALDSTGGRLTMEKALVATKRKEPKEINYIQYIALMSQLGAAA